MLRKYVTVRNADSVEHAIIDRRFSNGKLILGPGEEYGIANDVWMDHRRRHGAWLKDVSVIDAPVIAEDEPEKDLADYTMKELRETAAELEVTIPVGTTKLDAARMIQAAGSGETPEKGNDDENTI